MWNFVAAGLYKGERNMVYLYMPMSLGLFFAGAALAYFAAFDYVLNFLFWFNAQMGIAPTPRISEWMTLVLLMPLGFGLSFQLPLVMVALERIGIFTVQSYLSSWRIAVVIIFALAMFLTPADPGSMLMMAMPLTGLYFLGIWLCKRLPRGESLGPGRFN
jgi:sec-independent protein translocase protein TatC